MGQYDNLDHGTLIRLLQRRDAECQPGVVWERGERDFVFLRELGGRLQDADVFSVDRLSFS